MGPSRLLSLVVNYSVQYVQIWVVVPLRRINSHRFAPPTILAGVSREKVTHGKVVAFGSVEVAGYLRIISGNESTAHYDFFHDQTTRDGRYHVPMLDTN